MDINDLILRIFIPAIPHIILLYLLLKTGKNPDPLPRSKCPKYELIEAGIYTLIVIICLALNIFVLKPIFDSIYITLGLNSITFLFVPLIYTHYKNHWTIKDLGINSKIKSWQVAVFSIIINVYIGFYNSLFIEISLFVLVIFFYSNAFLEEFLFRGVIQSKLERALGQKKAIIFQGLLFMLIHIPVNTFQFFLDVNYLLFFSRFGFQLINGFAFGLIYLKTRNIWMPIICHYLNNWLGAIITLFL
ncbi:MAG: lysostaphin resistance A-like protein [Candidatus Hodarchaeota archaeon]